MSRTKNFAEYYKLNSGKLYLDNAATAIKSDYVAQKQYEYSLKYQLNPMLSKSIETQILENARLDLLNYFNLNLNEYQAIFTSGSTEGLNLVLQSVFLNSEKSVIISSGLEHKAVLDTIGFLETIGADLRLLQHDKEGVISVEKLRHSIDENVSLVSIMHVNNETGSINNIRQISDSCRDHGVPFICDTTQSIGKIELQGSLFDAFVGSAHKFGGPFGVGFVIIKKDLITNPVQHGGKQEFSLRPGTHNLPGILAMIDALKQDFELDLNFVENTLKELGLDINQRIGQQGCDYIYAFEVQNIVDFEKSYPNHIVGRGSACNSGLLMSSHVYAALGYDENVVRISF